METLHAELKPKAAPQSGGGRARTRTPKRQSSVALHRARPARSAPLMASHGCLNAGEAAGLRLVFKGRPLKHLLGSGEWGRPPRPLHALITHAHDLMAAARQPPCGPGAPGCAAATTAAAWLPSARNPQCLLVATQAASSPRGRGDRAAVSSRMATGRHQVGGQLPC